jgi:VIT1/CCC1 family predicted Fe2+/Mn2+ transporter
MASLMMGVVAANVTSTTLMITGVAAWIAGAMSMAAGEYVSVSSQLDIEAADLEKERVELLMQPEHEHRELAQIYEARGVSPDLAKEVATQLMAHDALGAHARDELGMMSVTTARPLQAAVVSAVAFSVGAVLPLCMALFIVSSYREVWIAGISLLFLALLGAWSAKIGGASVVRAIGRVVWWGSFSMLLTAAIGRMLGVIA